MLIGPSVDEVSHSNLTAGEALCERIFNTRSLHLNEFGVRMHKYEPLARSIARETNCCRQLEKFKSHAYSHCRTKYLNFSVSRQKFH